MGLPPNSDDSHSGLRGQCVLGNFQPSMKFLYAHHLCPACCLPPPLSLLSPFMLSATSGHRQAAAMTVEEVHESSSAELGASSVPEGSPSPSSSVRVCSRVVWCASFEDGVDFNNLWR